MQEATCSGVRDRDTPACSKRSALPLFLVADLLPCLAIFAPQELATRAEVVDTLKIPIPVPPVPQVSIKLGSSISTLVERSRITPTAPSTSSTVSPFIESAIKNAPIWASVTFPSNISRIISDISSLVRFLLADT